MPLPQEFIQKISDIIHQIIDEADKAQPNIKKIEGFYGEILRLCDQYDVDINKSQPSLKGLLLDNNDKKTALSKKSWSYVFSIERKNQLLTKDYSLLRSFYTSIIYKNVRPILESCFLFVNKDIDPSKISTYFRFFPNNLSQIEELKNLTKKNLHLLDDLLIQRDVLDKLKINGFELSKIQLFIVNQLINDCQTKQGKLKDVLVFLRKAKKEIYSEETKKYPYLSALESKFKDQLQDCSRELEKFNSIKLNSLPKEDVQNYYKLKNAYHEVNLLLKDITHLQDPWNQVHDLDYKTNFKRVFLSLVLFNRDYPKIISGLNRVIRIGGKEKYAETYLEQSKKIIKLVEHLITAKLNPDNISDDDLKKISNLNSYVKSLTADTDYKQSEYKAFLNSETVENLKTNIITCRYSLDQLNQNIVENHQVNGHLNSTEFKKVLDIATVMTNQGREAVLALTAINNKIYYQKEDFLFYKKNIGFLLNVHHALSKLFYFNINFSEQTDNGKLLRKCQLYLFNSIKNVLDKISSEINQKLHLHQNIKSDQEKVIKIFHDVRLKIEEKIDSYKKLASLLEKHIDLSDGDRRNLAKLKLNITKLQNLHDYCKAIDPSDLKQTYIRPDLISKVNRIDYSIFDDTQKMHQQLVYNNNEYLKANNYQKQQLTQNSKNTEIKPEFESKKAIKVNHFTQLNMQDFGNLASNMRLISPFAYLKNMFFSWKVSLFKKINWIKERIKSYTSFIYKNKYVDYLLNKRNWASNKLSRAHQSYLKSLNLLSKYAISKLLYQSGEILYAVYLKKFGTKEQREKLPPVSDSLYSLSKSWAAYYVGWELSIKAAAKYITLYEEYEKLSKTKTVLKIAPVAQKIGFFSKVKSFFSYIGGGLKNFAFKKLPYLFSGWSGKALYWIAPKIVTAGTFIGRYFLGPVGWVLVGYDVVRVSIWLFDKMDNYQPNKKLVGIHIKGKFYPALNGETHYQQIMDRLYKDRANTEDYKKSHKKLMALIAQIKEKRLSLKNKKRYQEKLTHPQYLNNKDKIIYHKDNIYRPKNYVALEKNEIIQAIRVFPVQDKYGIEKFTAANYYLFYIGKKDGFDFLKDSGEIEKIKAKLLSANSKKIIMVREKNQKPVVNIIDQTTLIYKKIPTKNNFIKDIIASRSLFNLFKQSYASSIFWQGKRPLYWNMDGKIVKEIKNSYFTIQDAFLLVKKKNISTHVHIPNIFKINELSPSKPDKSGLSKIIKSNY